MPTRHLPFVVAVWSLLLPLLAQELPGVRSALIAPSFVPVAENVRLTLVLQVDADTEIPGEMLTGVRLQVRADDRELPAITRPGKAGMVAVAAGTRIERSIEFPAASFVPSPELTQIAVVTVAWQGLAGTSCLIKVAPDNRRVDLDRLDLARTQVVLVTNYGDMRFSFRPEKAPKTVRNFLQLCLSGFYDGTKFHRVKQDFMIQGGDPNTKDGPMETWGGGGPGYAIKAEFSDLRHLRGTLSMARGSDPDSAGSQFFVVHKDSPHLDGKYSAFGNLEEGADTLDRIAYVPVGGVQRETPVSPVIIRHAIVLPVTR